MALSLSNIAKKYNLELIGDSESKVSQIKDLLTADSSSISFASKSKQIADIKNSNAICIITTKELAKYCNNNVLISINPYLDIAKISFEFKKLSNAIDKSAIIDDSAIIGNNTTIDMGCMIGKNVIIGDNCHLYPNVSIMDNSKIGDNCIILSGAVIGSQGFGNILDGESWQNIYHSGSVNIANNVHIGANTTIDRGTFSDTIIAEGVRIDNLVHIAHNVKVGANTAIAALAGIAGSTHIGKNCKIGGQVGILDHLNIADNTTIHATSTVNKDIDESGEYTSFMPIMPHGKWKKAALLITKFDKIVRSLKIKISQI